MTRIRIAVAGTVAVLAATVLLLGGVLREPAQAGGTAAPTRVLADVFAAGFGPAGGTTIADFQARAEANPKDAQAAVLLGLAYQQRVRETADFSDLGRSEIALKRALTLAPDDPDAISGLASLALARHDFEQALTLGRRAHALAPATARHYGVVGDALLELGRYEQAFQTFDRMARLKPGVASYSRVSYARELLGDKTGAIEAMKLALDAATGQREALAWTHVQLGKIYLGTGRLDQADSHFRAALQIFPTYLFAFEGRAQVELARGRLDAAVALARRSADEVPLPQFVGTLADVYRASGKQTLAREQYAVMGAIERLLRSGGVRSDLEITLFNVDHGINLDAAVSRARRARHERPSIEGDAVLAWALARTDQCREALVYSKRALRLGTRDAAKFFQRGMIERCLGRDAAAGRWFQRALQTNPHFSPHWAPVARRYTA